MNVTKRPFLDLGDITAPKGSLAYVRAVYEEARQTLNDTMGERKDLKLWIDALREDNRFQKLANPKGQQYLTWEEFCTTPQPFGLGYDPADIEYIIQEREKTPAQRAQQPLPLAKHGEIGNGRNRDYNTISTQGDSADYLTARIARDRPDILERMRAGEYKSVRAAALDAGIVKRRMSVPTDIESLADYLVEHLERDEFNRLVDLLAERIAVDI